MMWAAVVVVLVVAAVAAANAMDPGTHFLELVTPDGLTREFYLHVPTQYTDNQSVTLVFDTHGYMSSAPQQAFFTGYRDLADEETFAVVHAQGVRNSWNAGQCCGYALSNDIDDVLFFRMIVDEVASLINIDRARVFATGLSNGGFISHRLAMEASDVFNAIAPVAATAPYFLDEPNRTIGVYHIHGTADALVPYDGSPIFRSVEASMEYWREQNGCGTRTEVTDEDAELSTECVTWIDCPESRFLTLCTHDGAHVVPSYTAEKTWSFFVSQPPLNFTAPAFRG